MNYPLENLGHERFQQLCQALIAKEYPNTQCFPIGQADGGRDAVHDDDSSDGFTVFQVKYATERSSASGKPKWLDQVLASERKKISKLVERGATRYILITNASGTGTLDRGSIDRTANEMLEHFPIPTQCWWRDKIERKLDDAWDIKWAFPEVLSNYDIIRMVLERREPAAAERRAQAVKAAIRDQYEKERDVRFKQVDLRNDLLDLFVDVPIRVPELEEQKATRRTRLSVLHEIARSKSNARDRSKQYIGAATLLLDEMCQTDLRHIVLEGAPGQGKSTIAQYVCQIHRHHLLNVALSDERIPVEHRLQPVRVPLKIDCRDLDVWLQGGNPFPATDKSIVGQVRSLESFLCAHVRHHSGGSSFDVDDLHAMGSLSAMLFVFDGLDEVADVDRRRDVVRNITKGIARLEEVSLSVQSIVTSRPAAYANSPNFPQDRYLYVQLTSIGRKIIEEYTERWLRAREMEDREANEVKSILASKLDQPHMAELTRNPMQLAILLSLIHSRGVSLPDKRTALYDSYVDLFFAREAEKNTVVRDYRDLLIDIHRYLAWVLHSEAQTKGTQGSVSESRLRQLVSHYLAAEGHDTNIVSQLFSGITERVVALVSRVEGTYEFEVQPLREYFAARHLYNTAPYSPAGGERRGTLPERFDALSRDFFWQNVTRFYAGCYSRGELPSLVHSLKELSESEGYSMTGHPQALAAALLSDWTFAQYPRLMKDVVSLVVDGVAIKHLSTSNHRIVRRSTLVLPHQSGREELVARCFELLLGGVPDDYSSLLLELIAENVNSREAFPTWRRGIDTLRGERLTEWIAYGRYLGVLELLEDKDREFLTSERNESKGKRLSLMLVGGALPQQLEVEQLEQIVPWIFSRPDVWGPRIWGEDILGQMARVLSPIALSYVFRWRRDTSLSNLWSDRFPKYREDSDRAATKLPRTELAKSCERFATVSRELSDRYFVSQWRRNIEPWNALVEAGRREFGNQWAFYVLGFIASGIKSENASYRNARELFDDQIDLCKRARFARLRAGSAAWWKRHLVANVSWAKKTFMLLLFFTWSGPKTMAQISPLADEVLASLPGEWWTRLHMAMGLSGRYWLQRRQKKLSLELDDFPDKLSPRFVVLVSGRLKSTTVGMLYSKFLNNYEGDDTAVLQLSLESALRCAVKEKNSWQKWLPIIANCYMKGVTIDGYLAFELDDKDIMSSWGLDVSTAAKVIQRCDQYPLELVELAEQVCRSELAKQIVPVGQVATRDNWFEETADV